VATIVPVRRPRRRARKVSDLAALMHSRGWRWSVELQLWVPMRQWEQKR
jgi:hypothetical protein